MKKWLFIIAALATQLATTISHAQSTSDADGSAPLLYVGQFQPATATSEGFGPLHAIKSGLHTHRVDSNAAALTKALVNSLSKAHIAAQPSPPDGPLPKSGWLVSGVFYSLDDGGHLITIPFLSTRKAPNVEVTVTLADLAKDPHTPFAVLGTDSVLKGQGAPLGWNPYVVSARFVVHRIEGDQSLNRLADDITQKILQNRAELSHRDVSPAAGTSQEQPNGTAPHGIAPP
jgi:hypothetical protein